MDPRERAIQNELSILNVIAQQRWIREDELSLLSGMSLPMVRRTCARLSAAGEVYRERKSCGYFVRLRQKGAVRTEYGKSGKKVEIPASWRHDCIAVQSLLFLQDALRQSHIETEAQIRQRGQQGKIPDGLLLPDAIWLEAEMSRKSGKETMGRMARTAVERARQGRTTVISYPFPPSHCDGKDHERRVTSAVRSLCGDMEMPHIKLLRCVMTSKLDYQHARARMFKLIDLPAAHANACRTSGPVIVEVAGYRWREFGAISELWLNGELIQTICWHDQTDDAPALADSDDILEAGWDETFADFQVRVKNAWLSAHVTGKDIYSVFR